MITEIQLNDAVKNFQNKLAEHTGFEQLERDVWDILVLFQDLPFFTSKGLEFTYIIKGNEIFFSRKEKSVTRSTVDIALKKALELGEEATGPKKLGVFGASYIYPVFIRIGLITLKKK